MTLGNWLAIHGFSQAAFSRLTELNKATVCFAVHGALVSARVRDVIRDATGGDVNLPVGRGRRGNRPKTSRNLAIFALRAGGVPDATIADLFRLYHPSYAARIADRVRRRYAPGLSPAAMDGPVIHWKPGQDGRAEVSMGRTA